jgi:predicted CoA-binding protein
MATGAHLDEDQSIAAFLAGDSFAVAGASQLRSKYGNKVLRCYLQHGRQAFPINPHRAEVEGVRCYPDLAALPERVHGVSLITQPSVSASIVDQALALGIRHFWFQVGSEHPAAIARAREAGANVIAYGPCVLVVLGFREGGR